MRLLIIRHAKAEARDDTLWPDDSLRPLTEKGADQFRRSAAGLGRLVSPESLLTSPFMRAKQTADILHTVAKWPAPQQTETLAGDGPEIAALARQYMQESPDATLAVVGHEPTLSELISTLVSGNPLSRILMKPGAAALLDIVTSPSERLAGRLEWLAQPKLTRTMA